MGAAPTVPLPGHPKPRLAEGPPAQRAADGAGDPARGQRQRPRSPAAPLPAAPPPGRVVRGIFSRPLWVQVSGSRSLAPVAAALAEAQGTGAGQQPAASAQLGENRRPGSRGNPEASERRGSPVPPTPHPQHLPPTFRRSSRDAQASGSYGGLSAQGFAPRPVTAAATPSVPCKPPHSHLPKFLPFPSRVQTYICLRNP